MAFAAPVGGSQSFGRPLPLRNEDSPSVSPSAPEPSVSELVSPTVDPSSSIGQEEDFPELPSPVAEGDSRRRTVTLEDDEKDIQSEQPTPAQPAPQSRESPEIPISVKGELAYLREELAKYKDKLRKQQDMNFELMAEVSNLKHQGKQMEKIVAKCQNDRGILTRYRALLKYSSVKNFVRLMKISQQLRLACIKLFRVVEKLGGRELRWKKETPRMLNELDEIPQNEIAACMENGASLCEARRFKFIQDVMPRVEMLVDSTNAISLFMDRQLKMEDKWKETAQAFFEHGTQLAKENQELKEKLNALEDQTAVAEDPMSVTVHPPPVGETKSPGKDVSQTPTGPTAVGFYAFSTPPPKPALCPRCLNASNPHASPSPSRPEQPSDPDISAPVHLRKHRRAAEERDGDAHSHGHSGGRHASHCHCYDCMKGCPFCKSYFAGLLAHCDNNVQQLVDKGVSVVEIKEEVGDGAVQKGADMVAPSIPTMFSPMQRLLAVKLYEFMFWSRRNPYTRVALTEKGRLYNGIHECWKNYVAHGGGYHTDTPCPDNCSMCRSLERIRQQVAKRKKGSSEAMLSRRSAGYASRAAIRKDPHSRPWRTQLQKPAPSSTSSLVRTAYGPVAVGEQAVVSDVVPRLPESLGGRSRSKRTLHSAQSRAGSSRGSDRASGRSSSRSRLRKSVGNRSVPVLSPKTHPYEAVRRQQAASRASPPPAITPTYESVYTYNGPSPPPTQPLSYPSSEKSVGGSSRPDSFHPSVRSSPSSPSLRGPVSASARKTRRVRAQRRSSSRLKPRSGEDGSRMLKRPKSLLDILSKSSEGKEPQESKDGGASSTHRRASSTEHSLRSRVSVSKQPAGAQTVSPRLRRLDTSASSSAAVLPYFSPLNSSRGSRKPGVRSPSARAQGAMVRRSAAGLPRAQTESKNSPRRRLTKRTSSGSSEPQAPGKRRSGKRNTPLTEAQKRMQTRLLMSGLSYSSVNADKFKEYVRGLKGTQGGTEEKKQTDTQANNS